MRRRIFLAALLGGIAVAGPAAARDRSDGIIRALERKGYHIAEVSRTLLGRVRITATKNGGRREIILNPATGEILRDLWIARGQGDGAGGDWDDWGEEDDDRDDPDDDDDNGGDDKEGDGGGGSDGGGDDD